MISETFRWWLVVEGAGLLALPIALLLFQRLPGRGYAFATPVGLLLGAYPVLPTRPGSIVWVFLLLAAVDVYLIRRRGAELRLALAERAGFVVAVEVVFTGALFVAAHLRSYIPEIEATEKPMEFMLLNAASRSRYYSPDDAWFAGASGTPSCPLTPSASTPRTRSRAPGGGGAPRASRPPATPSPSSRSSASSSATSILTSWRSPT